MSQRRRDLFTFQKERIEMLAVDAAKRRGLQFVVLVLDLDDANAIAIAEKLSSSDEVQKHRDDSIKRGVQPCLLYDSEWNDAEVLLKSFDGWQKIKTLHETDPTAIPVAVFGDGGVSFAAVRLPQG